MKTGMAVSDTECGVAYWDHTNRKYILTMRTIPRVLVLGEHDMHKPGDHMALELSQGGGGRVLMLNYTRNAEGVWEADPDTYSTTLMRWMALQETEE